MECVVIILTLGSSEHKENYLIFVNDSMFLWLLHDTHPAVVAARTYDFQGYITLNMIGNATEKHVVPSFVCRKRGSLWQVNYLTTTDCESNKNG